MESNYQNNIDTFSRGGRAPIADREALDRETIDREAIGQTPDRESWKYQAQTFYTDVTNLVEKEGQLIRAEMSEKVTQVKEGVAALITAGAVMFMGAISLVITATVLLALVVPLWLSSVIVTVAFLAIGAIMLAAAKKKMEPDHLVPRKSIDALSEIRYSLKEKVNEITKH